MSKANLSLKWVILDFISRCDNLRTFKQAHAFILRSALFSNDLVIVKVANFLGKYVSVDYACKFLRHFDWSFSSFPCNTLISGYAANDTPRTAIVVYRWSAGHGFMPDEYTFPAVLKSCAKFSGDLEGRQFHSLAVKTAFCHDIYVQNSLVHMYATLGDCFSAGRVFDDMVVRDVVSWTGLISGYGKAGLFYDAISLFSRMDVESNVATLVSTLVACGRTCNLTLGKSIHGLATKRTFGKDLVVGNALLDMYVKSVSLCDAKQIFDELSGKDIVSWTTIIVGLVQNKCAKESLDLFCKMLSLGIEPDKFILTSVLSACASLGDLDHGRWIHEYIDQNHIKWDVHIGTAMVDMYAKCGCVETAKWAFDRMPSRNVHTWNAFLGGLAVNGNGKEALIAFEEILGSDTRPNAVTFLAVLTACCHSGLVDEGRKYFSQMTSQEYNVSPRLEHYGCMVDLLCRGGFLGEALKLVKTMPMPPDVQIMGALLSACKAYGDAGISLEILNCLKNLESQDGGVYVLLSNIYATNKRWGDVTRIRRWMKERGIKKAPGSSLVNVENNIHEFFLGYEPCSKKQE